MPSLNNSNSVKIAIDTTGDTKGIDTVKNSLFMLSGEAETASTKHQMLSKAADVAKVGLIAMGAAAVVTAKSVVEQAADYEQSLNIFASVSGATGDQMVQVAAKARDLGKDISLPGISASDAALAMVELAKAGLSVNDAMDASKGVLSLAKAGQMDTAAAAEVAANALNAFGLKGTDATRVADLLAAAANASSADVKDLAYSLQMSGAGAAAMKIPVQDLTAMIGEMANNGIKGSDAGTSLKTMFINLIPQSKSASDAMKKLGLDFYDAQGHFVGTREAIKQLQDGTKNLTDEQKANAIQTIFGTDASRAANILIKEGTDGYDKMAAAVNKQGAAAQLAAAQNSGFKGALDNVKSTIETIAIDVGMQMIPTLTALARSLADNIQPAFDNVVRIGGQVVNIVKPAFIGLGNAIMQDLVPAVKAFVLSDFVKIIGITLVGAVYAATVALTGVIKVVSSFVSAVAPLTPILLGVTAAIVAYQVAVIATGIATRVYAGYQALMTTSVMFYNGTLITARASTIAMAVAQEGLNLAMKANPIGLLIAATVGIVTAYVNVVNSTDQAKNATDRLKSAQDALKQSSDALRDAQKQLKDATFDQKGAALNAEAAQRRYNDAVAQYGPNSLEARQAAHDLEGANNDLAKANDNVKNKTNDASKAEQDAAAKKQAMVDAEKAKQRELEITRQRLDSQVSGLDVLTGKLNNLNGRVFNFTVNGAYNDYASKQAATGTGVPYKLPGKATGGPVHPGQPYFVGDNPDGSLNKTSELFIPDQAGHIMNASDLQKMLGGGGGNQTTIQTTIHNVYLQDGSAVTTFFDKLDQDNILVGKGMTPNRGTN